MIAGFFIGLFVWTAVYCYCLCSAESLDSFDYGAVFASLIILAGNGAGIGALAQWGSA